MTAKLQEIIEGFQLVDDDEMRLEVLLDYARKLPPLPPHYEQRKAEGAGRVDECMTPVFMWAEVDANGQVALHVDVAEEAPTVKGFCGVVREAYHGAPASAVAAMPNDLMHQLGLSRVIRMNRAVGLNAIVARVKREVAAAAESAGSASKSAGRG